MLSEPIASPAAGFTFGSQIIFCRILVPSDQYYVFLRNGQAF